MKDSNKTTCPMCGISTMNGDYCFEHDKLNKECKAWVRRLGYIHRDELRAIFDKYKRGDNAFYTEVKKLLEGSKK